MSDDTKRSKPSEEDYQKHWAVLRKAIEERNEEQLRRVMTERQCDDLRKELEVIREAFDHWEDHDHEICNAPEYTDIMMALQRGGLL